MELMPSSTGNLGKRVWAIAEGYIPAWSNGPEPEMESHETACILNIGNQEAKIVLTVYFSDREPIGPYNINVPPQRTLHMRFNDLQEPAPIPKGVPYASVFMSNVPIIIQHTRLDSRQAENALLSTIACALD